MSYKICRVSEFGFHLNSVEQMLRVDLQSIRNNFREFVDNELNSHCEWRNR